MSVSNNQFNCLVNNYFLIVTGGFGTGIIIPCSSLFAVDVASVEIRGKLGIVPQVNSF